MAYCKMVCHVHGYRTKRDCLAPLVPVLGIQISLYKYIFAREESKVFSFTLGHFNINVHVSACNIQSMELVKT